MSLGQDSILENAQEDRPLPQGPCNLKFYTGGHRRPGKRRWSRTLSDSPAPPPKPTVLLTAKGVGALEGDVDGKVPHQALLGISVLGRNLRDSFLQALQAKQRAREKESVRHKISPVLVHAGAAGLSGLCLLNRAESKKPHVELASLGGKERLLRRPSAPPPPRPKAPFLQGH